MSFFCPSCGYEVSSDARICLRCGCDLSILRDTTVSATKNQTPRSQHLLEYLSKIIDMENSIYFQTLLSTRIRRLINASYLSPPPDPPRLQVEPTPEVDSQLDRLNQERNRLMGLTAFFLVVTIVSFFRFFVISGGSFSSWWWSFPIMIVSGILSLYFVVSLSETVETIKSEKKRINDVNSRIDQIERRNQANVKKYQNSLAHYEEGYRLYREQCAKLNEGKKVYRQAVELIENECRKSESVLSSLYDQKIIYPSYQGFVNVCSLYDYLASGMCNSLEDAYRVLVAHIDAQQIVTRLDNISSKLSTIQQNQHRLYTAITSSQSTLNDILQVINTMPPNVLTSELNNYYRERNAIQSYYIGDSNYKY